MASLAPHVGHRRPAERRRTGEANLCLDQKSLTKFGLDPSYADGIGDMLVKHGMEAEAVAYSTHIVTENDGSSPWYMPSVNRLLARRKDAEWTALVQQLLSKPSDAHGAIAVILAQSQLAAKDLDGFEKTMTATRTLQNERPFRGWGVDAYVPQNLDHGYRNSKDVKPEDKRRVYTAVRSLKVSHCSPSAQLALLELDGSKGLKPMERLLAYQAVTTEAADDTISWDRLAAYAQAAMAPRTTPPPRRWPRACWPTWAMSIRRASRRAATWSVRAMPAWEASV